MVKMWINVISVRFCMKIVNLFNFATFDLVCLPGKDQSSLRRDCTKA